MGDEDGISLEGYGEMNRAERRRIEKEKNKKVPTYNLNPDQCRAVIEKELKAVIMSARDDTVNTAMTLMLALPMKVLMEHYWKKTCREKLPGFTKLVLEYYDLWQDGELDMDNLKDELWEYGGIRLEEAERK